jgi:hypothetical protein
MKKCKCNNIIATDGVAEPVIKINDCWRDLISLDFECPICNGEIEFSNNNNYPDMWKV